MSDNDVMIQPDLQSSLLCDDVRQERNGKFILIGLFDIIGVREFPMVYQRLCVVNRWCCGDGEFMQQSRILHPDGVTPIVEGKKIPVKLAGNISSATSVELFMNVKFEEPGTYWIEILLDDDLRLRYPLQVNQVSAPSPGIPPQN